jgi:hypothetical protein
VSRVTYRVHRSEIQTCLQPRASRSLRRAALTSDFSGGFSTRLELGDPTVATWTPWLEVFSGLVVIPVQYFGSSRPALIYASTVAAKGSTAR